MPTPSETHEPDGTSPAARVIAMSTMAGLDVDTLVANALTAQRQIESWSEARINGLLHALANVVADHAHRLAVDTVVETGMGNVHDKTFKNSIASVGVSAFLAGHIGQGEIGFDSECGVAEIASPVGVVAGLVPATHPVATFIFKVLIALKGRNAIILSPSRRAQRVSEHVGQMIREKLREMGAPVDLVQWLGAGSTRQTVATLMSDEHIGVVLATGGRAMVQAAYRSGRPAIGVGPGNAPVLIGADADLRHVAHSVVISKSFDNGLICGAENHLVVHSAVRAQLLDELMRHRVAVLTQSERARLHEVVVNVDTLRFTPAFAGRDAATLASLARIERPYRIALLVVPVQSVADAGYLAFEKLAPVMSLFTVADMDEGMTVCRALLEIDGAGHTAVVHTRNGRLIDRFAAGIPASRILVNSPATQGLMGLTTGLTPSLTLGCGTWGGTSTTNSVTYRDLLNIKRVAYYRPEHDDEYPA